MMRDEIDALGALVGIVEVERWRHDLVAQRENAEDALHRARAAQQMADRRLGARHRRARKIVAEHALCRRQLDRVGHRRGAVRVDIVDVGRGHPRLAQRHAHRQLRALALRMRRGDVIGVARQTVTDYLGIDLRAARLGVLIFLEHDHPRALAHHEAVTVLVIGAAGLFGAVVHAAVERARLREARHAERIDRALRTARQHDVGVVVADHPRRVADRMRTGRTGGDDRMIRPHQAVLDRNLPRNQVDEPPVDEMRTHAARTALVQVDRLDLDPRQAADPRADRHARAHPHFLVHLGQPGVFQRLPRGVDAIDDERVDLPLDLVVDALVGIEAIFMVLRLHLARDQAFLPGGVEARDRTRARFPGDQVRPGGFHIRPERGDETKSGDDDATHRLPFFPPLAPLPRIRRSS